MWDKDIVKRKIRSRGLVWQLTESFLKGEGLNQKLQMKICKLGDLCNEFIQTYQRRGSGDGAPSRWAIFRNFFEKKAILMPLDHISHVFRTI